MSTSKYKNANLTKTHIRKFILIRLSLLSCTDAQIIVNTFLSGDLFNEPRFTRLAVNISYTCMLGFLFEEKEPRIFRPAKNVCWVWLQLIYMWKTYYRAISLIHKED